MGCNADTMQQRLGDGYYEQKLVREQIGQLTGRRFLDGYSSDEAQYQALLGIYENREQSRRSSFQSGARHDRSPFALTERVRPLLFTTTVARSRPRSHILTVRLLPLLSPSGKKRIADLS
ncbi:hypothetical protein XaFJ1_GM001855 [Xanthomonas albilineans]|nr:hypothetical protein XaFJ1_GM001855 [Xanthomonas albilineans]